MIQKLDKPLHEYRREPTEQELADVSRYLAEGKSQSEMARLMSQTRSRIKTLCNRVDVMEKALHLRQSDVVPKALDMIVTALEKISDNQVYHTKRVDALEVTCGRMSKALGMAKIRDRTQREKLAEQAVTIKQLRSTIRKAGLSV